MVDVDATRLIFFCLWRTIADRDWLSTRYYTTSMYSTIIAVPPARKLWDERLQTQVPQYF